jgi:Flp pilus assembly pilin Flp
MDYAQVVSRMPRRRTPGSPCHCSRKDARTLRRPLWQSHCSLAGRVTRLARAWLHEEDGQDLLEYMLLGATIAFAGVVAFSFLGGAMKDTYESWDTAVQSQELVEVPDPAPSPSPAP